MIVKIYKKDGSRIEYDHVKNLKETMLEFISGNNDPGFERYLMIEFFGSYETEPIEDIARVAVRFRSDEFQKGE